MIEKRRRMSIKYDARMESASRCVVVSAPMAVVRDAVLDTPLTSQLVIV